MGADASGPGRLENTCTLSSKRDPLFPIGLTVSQETGLGKIACYHLLSNLLTLLTLKIISK